MKTRPRMAALMFCVSVFSTDLFGNEPTLSGPQPVTVSHEVDAYYSYIGGAHTWKGREHFGGVDEQVGDFKYVASPQISKEWLLRFGFEWERLSFGAPCRAPIPGELQQVNAIIGFDYQINERWLVRAEALPGVYSDFEDITLRDVGVPFVFGGSYLVNDDLQWFFGARFDVRSQYPILPAAGVRWKFADEWTLMFLFPQPRLIYELSPKVQLYVGADIESATYRVGDSFGSNRGRPGLDKELLDYYEVRIGPGCAWKILPNVTLEVEGGMLAGRRFDFHNRDVIVKSDQAPYAQIACHTRF